MKFHTKDGTAKFFLHQYRELLEEQTLARRAKVAA